MPKSAIMPITLAFCCTMLGCSKETEDTGTPDAPIERIDGPLGIPLINDNVTYAGTSVIDITPTITETFNDANNNGEFDGCFDDPEALGNNCAETFDDANGNGWFDAVFIGGFDPKRPANFIEAPISARALVISHNPRGSTPNQYIAWVTLDIIGMNGERVVPAADLLEADGFSRDRLIVTSIHNHQAPDTVGLFGDPLSLISGANPAYLERITDSIETAVRAAAVNMQPVVLKVGQTMLHTENKAFNGQIHGGTNPIASAKGMINDIRDPLVISDQLLVLHGSSVDTGDGVFTLTCWSGHPEVEGGRNLGISADWVGVTRDALEKQLGGTALHVPKSLGGMQSALYLSLPLIDADGVHHFQTCSPEAIVDAQDTDCFDKNAGDTRHDAEGDPVPLLAESHTREFAIAHGWHIAEAAENALANGEVIGDMDLDIESEPIFVPINNPIYQTILALEVLDYTIDQLVTDPILCPEVESPPMLGCYASRVFRLRLGPVEFLTAPAEVTPEIAWGLPDEDPIWVEESNSLAARGADSKYFIQHPDTCQDITFEECKNVKTVGDCNCLKMHAIPFEISYNPSQRPLLELSHAKYKAMVSMTDSYFSYALPETDIHYTVSLLDDSLGDHYEEAIALSRTISSKLWEAHDNLNQRW